MNLPEAYNRTIRVEAVLTEREIQVAKLIARDFQHKAMAEQLRVSVKTIEKHRSTLYGKLGLHSGVQITHWAIAHGLVNAITDWKTV